MQFLSEMIQQRYGYLKKIACGTETEQLSTGVYCNQDERKHTEEHRNLSGTSVNLCQLCAISL